MNRFLSLSVSSLLLLGGALTVAQAQTKTVSVKFPAGKSSTTVSGQITGRSTIDYKVTAKAGQTLNVNLTSANTSCNLNVIPAGGPEALHIGSTSGGKVNRMLPDDGVYTIRVYVMPSAGRRGSTARFKLSIGVSGQALPPLASSSDAKVKGSRYHATGTVKCDLSLFREVKECQAGVIRRTPDGSATVELKYKGFIRRILFVEGKPVASDSAQQMTFTQEGGETVVTFGGNDSFTIPEVLIVGG